MSAFCSLSVPSIFTAVCSAANWRSVLKMLNSAVVLPESGAGVGRAVVTRRLVESLAQPDDELVHRVLYLRAVAGEILPDAHGAALERHDRHEIGRIHLRVDELQRGVEGPQLIRGLHGGHIEVQSQQAVVAVASVARLFRRDLHLRGAAAQWGRPDCGDGAGSGELACGLQPLKLDKADGLRHAIFGQNEIIRRSVPRSACRSCP